MNCASDLVRGGWKLPETVGAADAGVLERASVLGGVSITEVICAIGVVWKVGADDGGVQ